MRVLLLGPPGSGKGTQAAVLAKTLGCPHIATGDLFRAEMKAQSELGKLADDYISHGNLVPDEIVNEMVRERLKQGDAEDWVLDGYPRTLPQAHTLEEILDALQRPLSMALNIDVPDEMIVERAVGRLVCQNCGAIYHLTSKPPRIMGICDTCQNVLVVREDDQPSTVRHRLAVYHRITHPVLSFYRERGLLREISGLGTRDEVGVRLQAHLAKPGGSC